MRFMKAKIWIRSVVAVGRLPQLISEIRSPVNYSLIRLEIINRQYFLQRTYTRPRISLSFVQPLHPLQLSTDYIKDFTRRILMRRTEASERGKKMRKKAIGGSKKKKKKSK